MERFLSHLYTQQIGYYKENVKEVWKMEEVGLRKTENYRENKSMYIM